MDTSENRIHTSIIIPVYNDKKYLVRTLTSIFNQTPSKYNSEVIVVDNGSDDDLGSIIREFTEVTLISEHVNLHSPYSCRNRGIELAKGDVIILLDSTCIPNYNWLKAGLDFLESSGADIIGGNVKFDFEGRLTGAKIYDSLTNIKMRDSVAKGVAKTANLFIRKSVFYEIGLFPEGVRSGADVRWTHRATSSGMKLVFCEEAIVYKPARGFKELVKKQWRVGTHQPLIWEEQGRKISLKAACKKIMLPVSPRTIKRLLTKQGSREMQSYFLSVWLTAQIIKIIMGLANCQGILKMKRVK